MRRARQRLVALAFAVAALVPSVARAFHAGSQFDKPAGAGGGGGVFYTGAPRDKGWDCTACHTDAPRAIRLDLASMPAALFQERRYVPGQAYVVTARLAGEHAGLASPQANYNGFAVAAVDATGKPVGRFSGYASDDLYDGGTALVSAGKKAGVTSWTVTWTAPAVMTGRVTFYLSVVDGNGADSRGDATLTDPWNDDLAVGAIAVDEGASAAREPFSVPRDTDRMRTHEARHLQPALARRLQRHQRLGARHRRWRHA